MAATEMSRVVDEEDDYVAGRENAEQKAGYDMDQICAYQTYKIVRIRDRNLGCLYWGLVTGVIMYITILIFNLEGRHAERDAGLGTTVVRFKGKAFSNGKVFDENDLRFPPVEPTGAFIMTKRIVVKDQKIGQCIDMDFPRRCPCRESEKCVQVDDENSYCEGWGWCPSLGDQNVASPPEGAIVERMEGLEHSTIQIMVGITFPRIGNRFYVAGDSPTGTDLYKNLTLGELVALAEPPINFEDALDRGALIGVSYSWTCEVTSDCEPVVAVKYLDAGNGFVQKRARHRGLVDGVEIRDAIYMYGFRIVVDSQGIGRRTSIVLIVIQVGSCLALLRTASSITDAFMLKWGGADRRKAYYKCKVTDTRDYSDLQDRINLIQDQHQHTPMLIGQSQERTGRGGAGGAHVALGLGPGARGGLASTLVRGRSNAASSAA